MWCEKRKNSPSLWKYFVKSTTKWNLVMNELISRFFGKYHVKTTYILRIKLLYNLKSRNIFYSILMKNFPQNLINERKYKWYFLLKIARNMQLGLFALLGWLSKQSREKSRKKVVFGRSSKIDLRSGRQKTTSTDLKRPTPNTISNLLRD